MLTIWSLVPLSFLNAGCPSESSQFTYCLILAWRNLSITLLACEMSAVVWCLNVVCHCLSFGLEWKLPWFSYSMTCLQGDQKSSPSLSLLSHSSLTIGARGRVYKHETTSLALECSSWLTRTGRTLHCPQPTFDLILQISRMNEFMPLQWFKVI